MADVGDNSFMRYIYRGEHNIIPREATHIFVDKGITFIHECAFQGHSSIIEVICHEDVKKIEGWAFNNCPRLRRVIMPGVEEVGDAAFCSCDALTYVECGKLEIVEHEAFLESESLKSISLLSARIVMGGAFTLCRTLTDVKFSSNLERIEEGAFCDCHSLERITIPLKNGLITADNIFQGCNNLKEVDLVEGVELHETIAALQLEEWRNDLNEGIDSINRILPDADAGYYEMDEEEDGEKSLAIRRWIRSVLRKIIHYQAEHQHVLNVAATTLQLALPHDIVNRSVLPFLELPSHTFELAEGGDEDEDESSYSEGSSSEGEESGMEEEDNDDEALSKRRRIEIEQRSSL